MSDYREGWEKLVRHRITSYWETLNNLDGARGFHGRRNGTADEDYDRPGLTIEIPLLWGTF